MLLMQYKRRKKEEEVVELKKNECSNLLLLKSHYQVDWKILCNSSYFILFFLSSPILVLPLPPLLKSLGQTESYSVQ